MVSGRYTFGKICTCNTNCSLVLLYIYTTFTKILEQENISIPATDLG